MKPRFLVGKTVDDGVFTEMRKGEGGADLWGDKACVGHMRLEVPVGHPGVWRYLVASL